MRNTFIIAALVLTLLPAEVNAAGRRRAAPSPVLPDDIVITFVPTVDGIQQSEAALLDVGTVRHSGGRTRGTTVTKSIGIRLTHRSGASGIARLRAYVQQADSRSSVRVDGVTLTTVPQLIEANAIVGATERHRIEVTVPVSAPEGALAGTITWEAEDIQ